MRIICVNKNYGDKTYQRPYLNILTAAVTRKESLRAIQAAPVCAPIMSRPFCIQVTQRYSRHNLSRM